MPYTNPQQHDQVVSLLTRAYWMEVESIMSYLAASTNPEGIRAEEVKEVLADDITDELGHARKFAQRIHELHGTVPGSLDFHGDQHTLQPPTDSTDIVAVIRGVIDAEQSAIDHYTQIVETCDGVDWTTQDMVIQILRDEQGHLRKFEGFLKEYDRQAKFRSESYQHAHA